MKKLLLSICASLAITSLIACGNETANTTNTTTDTNANLGSANTQNSTLESSLVASTSDTTKKIVTTNAPTANGGLNPEHGQPGHRCDIEVGAPLNSAPAAQAPQQMQVQPQMQTQQAAPQMQPQVAPPAQQTAPGFSGKPNPAHGQPGHRCDLEVGVTLP